MSTIIRKRPTLDKDDLNRYYYKKIEKLYKGFQSPTTPINKVRTSLAETIKKRGNNDHTGIYRLDLPTGAGKTNLSMRYAAHQFPTRTETIARVTVSYQPDPQKTKKEKAYQEIKNLMNN